MGAEGGTVTTGPTTESVVDEASILALWNLSPEHFEIVGTVSFKAWDGFAKEEKAETDPETGKEVRKSEVVSKRLYSYKAQVRPKSPVLGIGTQDAYDLAQEISLLPGLPRTYVPEQPGGTWFVVCLADWQIGKGEGGGSRRSVAVIQAAIAQAADRLRELQASGRRVQGVLLAGLGDLVEGCSEFYAMQSFQVDLDRRRQVTVVRRLLLRTIRTFGEFGLPMLIATAAGNHGENRKNGKAFTTFGDNDDVAVFEQVMDHIAEYPEKFGHPKFVLPGDDLSFTVDLAGVRLGAVHGHQFGKGASASAKAINWWKAQSLGDQPIGAAQILLSGHLHHFTAAPHGSRTHFQAPALDGGSEWYRQVAGVDSPSGLLTLLVGNGAGPLGWSDVQLITPTPEPWDEES